MDESKILFFKEKVIITEVWADMNAWQQIQASFLPFLNDT